MAKSKLLSVCLIVLITVSVFLQFTLLPDEFGVDNSQSTSRTANMNININKSSGISKNRNENRNINRPSKPKTVKSSLLSQNASMMANEKDVSTNFYGRNHMDQDYQQQQQQEYQILQRPRCALLFFGLPRSFELLVLPSIVKNILIPNKDNECDIFMHFFLVKSETKSRSGLGGRIDSMAAWKLEDAVRKLYSSNITDTDMAITRTSNSTNAPQNWTIQQKSPTPTVSLIYDTDDDFFRKRGKQLEKYRKTKGPDGKYLYYPWMAKSFTYPTSIDNIVKQWHSIQSVWELMMAHINSTLTKDRKCNNNEDCEKKRNSNDERNINDHNNYYSRVAMLRNDVVYVTPFNIYKRGVQTHIFDIPNSSTNNITGKLKYNNNDVIVPNWARFPINDRMIYGPQNAVRIWATERFQRLETHVRTYEPGYGMHSERFLNHSIFPAIQQLGYGVVADPDICFFRARADGSTWISDCATRNGAAKGFRNNKNIQALVEDIVGTSCVKSKFNKATIQLHCLPNENQNATIKS